MKFKSRKDNFFKFFVLGLSGLFIAIILIQIFFQREKFEFIFTAILMVMLIGLLFWLYFGTEYELSETELKYKSGPIRGKIKIEEITEIMKAKTLWSGLKPATARNGLILKYRKFEVIYISPETNDIFINKILEINNNIKIT
ncbi:MAG: PH domain-containing protein [Flavobacterium sp.]|uniref:PH domain-containing protein n=1 Tax=Flavobacterium sp. TaxID=239 RepID=UPI003267DF5C